MFLVGFMLISTTQLLPQLSQTLMGYDATTAGLTLGVGGIASLLLMPVVGFVTGRKIQPKWLILMAILGVSWSMLRASHLDLDIGFWTISTTRMSQVMWMPFLFIPISAVAYVGLPPDGQQRGVGADQPDAQPGRQLRRVLVTNMLQERSQFHHARLAEHITAYNGYGWSTPLAPVDAMVQAQASIMSYLDVFWLLGMLALIVAPVALLLPKVPKRAAAGH